MILELLIRNAFLPSNSFTYLSDAYEPDSWLNIFLISNTLFQSVSLLIIFRLSRDLFIIASTLKKSRLSQKTAGNKIKWQILSSDQKFLYNATTHKANNSRATSVSELKFLFKTWWYRNRFYLCRSQSHFFRCVEIGVGISNSSSSLFLFASKRNN